MSIKVRLLELQTSLQERIAETAKGDDPTSVIALARLLEECGNLLRRYEELESAMLGLEGSVRGNDPSVTAGNRDNLGLSPKERGREERERFLALLRMKGIKINQDGRSEVSFTIKQGKLGVAFSSENEKYPNRWFLGLPKENYALIVFLCRHRSSQTDHFILPRSVVSENLNYFSLSRDGQFKFSILRKGSRLELAIPKRKRLDLTPFRDNFGAF